MHLTIVISNANKKSPQQQPGLVLKTACSFFRSFSPCPCFSSSCLLSRNLFAYRRLRLDSFSNLRSWRCVTNEIDVQVLLRWYFRWESEQKQQRPGLRWSKNQQLLARPTDTGCSSTASVAIHGKTFNLPCLLVSLLLYLYSIRLSVLASNARRIDLHAGVLLVECRSAFIWRTNCHCRGQNAYAVLSMYVLHNCSRIRWFSDFFISLPSRESLQSAHRMSRDAAPLLP